MSSMTSEKELEKIIDDLNQEPPFLKKYNERLEMPISFVSSVFMYTTAIAAIIFFSNFLFKKPVKPAIPIMAVDGMDETGVGSLGSGGVAEPLAAGFAKPTPEDFSKFNLPTPLPQVKQELLDKIHITDPDVTIPDTEAAALGSLDQALRDKMLNFGQQKGDASSTGSGASGQVGSGPGGFGSDSTRARSMRWVMRFSVVDGKDYLRQLSVLKATILIPIPPENRDMMIFTDLANASPNRKANADEIDKLSRQMRFCDITAKAVLEIGQAFHLNFTPQSFFAFFPKDLEEKLARDEELYKGRKSKDIEETVFKVTVTGNSYSFVIVDQVPKKK